MNWIPLANFIIWPVLRNAVGWGQKALEDGKVEKYEWKQLASTVVRNVFVGVVAFAGLNGLGIDVSAMGAAAGATAFDYGWSLVKKLKK